MDALENVFVGQVLILHCHENGDCQEPDDRRSERSRVGSELLQSAHDFQCEHSRVSSELHCCTFQGTVASSQGGLSSFVSTLVSLPPGLFVKAANMRRSGAAVDSCSKQSLGDHSHDGEPTEALHQGQWC